ncbi:MAG: hypothetical protein EOP53_13280 [Sphingobacteriales bacterium]|nr:MAG: hypothetical protein EOP53_13280 [Sphingobacteriales bacterium]
MSTPITHSLHKNNRIAKWFIAICFALLATVPIYRNFYYSNGLLTYERHRAVIERRSEFYNPWQYRVLCPYAIEGLLWVYNHTVDKVFPIEQKFNVKIESNTGTTNETDQFVRLMQTPGAMKYMIIFILFRFAEHLLIFFLAWKLWSKFVKNKWLIFFGINFLALSLGNGVTVADLSFNTYMDISLYLLTANIIVYNKNHLLLIPITVLGAFNRETSIMIPALYFISQMDLSKLDLRHFSFKQVKFPAGGIWLVTILLYVIFFTIFVSLRVHFGYQPQQVWKVPAGLPMLKLNLASATAVKAYMELLATFAIVPLIVLYKFKSFPYLLKKWFLFLVPVWFLIHFVSVVAYQTRLFMVPFILVMLPMLLWLIENEAKKLYGNTAVPNEPQSTH